MGRTSILNDDMRNKIVEKAKLGIPSAIIAKEFGITRPTLTKILKENGIVRRVGKPTPLKIYYNDPAITLTEESLKLILKELSLQGIGSYYLLSKKTGLSKDIAYSFFKKGIIPVGTLKKMLNDLHIYTILLPASDLESEQKENASEKVDKNMQNVQ